MNTTNLPKEVKVHPIVLLSVVDHYNRVAKDTSKRVVGVLLGSSGRNSIDVVNSFAVPFEEQDDIWFFDHNYHEAMTAMFRKVTASEKVIGWYSTGPKICKNDIQINELIRRYNPNPIYVIIDAQLQGSEIPTKAYMAIEEVDGNNEGAETRMTFQHIPSKITAYEAEEVGVEHLLRDVKDTTVSTLSTQVNQRLLSLRSLIVRLKEMSLYLDAVVSGRVAPNHVLINQIQDIFNLVPRINNEEMAKAFAIKTNDRLLVVYLASLIRSVIALHGLIKNKIENRRLEKEAVKSRSAKLDAKPSDATEEKDKEKDKKDEDKDEKDEEKKNDPNMDVDVSQTG